MEHEAALQDKEAYIEKKLMEHEVALQNKEAYLEKKLMILWVVQMHGKTLIKLMHLVQSVTMVEHILLNCRHDQLTNRVRFFTNVLAVATNIVLDKIDIFKE